MSDFAAISSWVFLKYLDTKNRSIFKRDLIVLKEDSVSRVYIKALRRMKCWLKT